VAGLVLICLIIYRIDHYQRTRAKKGPEYDRPFACVSCGETVSISQGQCPMCGRKIPIGGAAEM
ncbi:MAG TPA: hypothetical protein VLA12_05830, partial [Planctomycetaceae bacterium]|nr:hypothetical protein [Planctomycetaceae bacterium]